MSAGGCVGYSAHTREDDMIRSIWTEIGFLQLRLTTISAKGQMKRARQSRAHGAGLQYAHSLDEQITAALY